MLLVLRAWIMNNPRILLVGAFLLALVYVQQLRLSNTRLAAQTERYRTDLTGWMKAYEALEANEQANRKVLAQRQREINRASKELRQLYLEIKKLKETDHEVKEWFDAHVPASVLRLRDQQLRGSGPSPSAKDGE